MTAVSDDSVDPSGEFLKWSPPSAAPAQWTIHCKYINNDLHEEVKLSFNFFLSFLALTPALNLTQKA